PNGGGGIGPCCGGWPWTCCGKLACPGPTGGTPGIDGAETCGAAAWATGACGADANCGPSPANARRAASANSEQEANRSAGRFAIARASTASRDGGNPARAVDTGGGCRCRCPWMTVAGCVDSYGAEPASSQYSVHASEYWSDRPSMSAPVSCSGDA